MEDRCTECGFDATSTPLSEVAAALEPVARSVAERARALPSEVVRRRSGSGVWSPIEYVGHLRESMAFHRWLIECAVTGETPRLPAVDPDVSVAEAGYQDATSTTSSTSSRGASRDCATPSRASTTISSTAPLSSMARP